MSKELKINELQNQPLCQVPPEDVEKNNFIICPNSASQVEKMPQRQFIHWKPLHTSAATICVISLAGIYSVTLIALSILGIVATAYSVCKVVQHIRKRGESKAKQPKHIEIPPLPELQLKVVNIQPQKLKDKAPQEPLGPLLPPRNKKDKAQAPLLPPRCNPVEKSPNLPPRDVDIQPRKRLDQ